LICFGLAVLTSPFKLNSRFEGGRGAPTSADRIAAQGEGRTQLTDKDRRFLVQMYRWFLSILKVVTIVQPQTLV
jgi:hypothetical protein